MAYEDDMIDAGFYDEESYLEYLLDEDDTRSERQRWIEEECSELELMADSGLYTEEELMEEVEERKRMRRQRFIKTGQNKGITPILSDEEEESVGYEYRQEEFEKDEDLISQIYNLVDKVLNEIPLFPTDGFDDDFYDNYDPLELKFGIKVIVATWKFFPGSRIFNFFLYNNKKPLDKNFQRLFCFALRSGVHVRPILLMFPAFVLFGLYKVHEYFTECF